MRITIFTEAIWPRIEATIDHLGDHRKEPLPDLVRSGLNFSIVLGSACYVEGVLETLLRAILQCRRSEYNSVDIQDLDLRRAMNTFFNRIETELAGGDRAGDRRRGVRRYVRPDCRPAA